MLRSPAASPDPYRTDSSSALLQPFKNGQQLVSSYLAKLQAMLSSPGAYALEADGTDAADLIMMPLSVVIFGATGDLARKKLFPACYQLCVLGLFPRDLKVIAVGRKAPADMAAFLSRQLAACKEDPRMSIEDFAARIAFHSGGYDAPDSFAALSSMINAHEKLVAGNRLFLLAVPPGVFGSICEMISTCVPRLTRCTAALCTL